MIKTFTLSPHTQRQLSSDRNLKSNILQTDSCIIEKEQDVVDNPDIKKRFSVSEKEIFNKMKYESNRLYSFCGKWPINSISPENLAEAGLFYLQQEDRVQCPFCFEIIKNWTSADKPLREHMKKSPKCPFLVGGRTGNIPLIVRPHRPLPTSQINPDLDISSAHADYKPRQPKMADIKRRLLTYVGWPDHHFTPKQLAECGLYYTGVKDVVTCFFCGGSLGNWVPEDNPWVEHKKFFPDCAFLSLAKKKNIKLSPTVVASKKESKLAKTSSATLMPTPDITTDIVSEALNIFPKSVVMDAVKKKEGNMFSLQELCDDILQLSNGQKSETQSEATNSQVSSSSESSVENGSTAESSDALLCKICMDNQRGVVFQPCGHFVSCWKCSQMISDCPLCRRPIINIIKTYFS